MPGAYTPPPAKPAGVARRGAQVVKPHDMTGTLQRLWKLTSGHRKGMGWVLLLSALVSASSIFSPIVIGQAVNLIYDRNAAGGAIALLAALYLGDWLVRFLQQFIMASLGQKIILHVRMQLFDALKALPLSYFDTHQHGELMSRLTNDVDNISTTISDTLAQLMTYGFTVIGIFAVMVSMNIPLTLVELATVVAVFAFTKFITNRTRKLYAKQQAILGTLDGHIEESISGISMVKAFGRERNVIEQFEEENEQYCDVATKAQIVSGYLMPIMGVLNNLSFVAVAVLSGVMAANGLMTVGLVSSFLLYSRQFARPFVEIANIYNTFQTAVAGAERIFETMDEQPEPPDRADAVSATTSTGDIVFDGAVFGYSPDTPVIKGIDLHIPPGTRAAIVGHTGSGKTTLMSLLARFYDLDEGRILLDGRDIRDYKLRDLRGLFGIVLQDTSLFAMSVRDNISYGKNDVPLESIMEAARLAGADEFIERLPEGYDTVLAQEGAELSQGERQLITIARAILADSPIIILDEATSSVDTMTEAKIRAALLKITSGRTSIIIAHRLSTIVDSDVIIMMEDGRIVEQGTHAQLMELGGRYSEMYRMQRGEA